MAYDDNEDPEVEEQDVEAPAPAPATEDTEPPLQQYAALAKTATGLPPAAEDDDWVPYKDPTPAASAAPGKTAPAAATAAGDDDWVPYVEPGEATLAGGLDVARKGLLEPLIKGAGDVISQASIVSPNPYNQLQPAELPPDDPNKAAFSVPRGRGPFGGEQASAQRQQAAASAAAQARIEEERKVPFKDRWAAGVGEKIKGAAPVVTPQEAATYPGTVAVTNVLGGGAGAVLAATAGSAIAGPIGGMAAGAAYMGAQSRGAEYDRASAAIDARIAYAQRAGDTATAQRLAANKEDEAAKAANMSTVVNTAIGAAPIGMILKPIQNMAPGAVGRLWAILDHSWKGSVTFGSAAELQEYLGAQMAKAYDPKAHYDFDYKRLLANLAGGLIFSAFGAATQRRPPAAPAPPAPPEPAPTQPGVKNQAWTGPPADIPPPVPPAQGALPFGQDPYKPAFDPRSGSYDPETGGSNLRGPDTQPPSRPAIGGGEPQLGLPLEGAHQPEPGRPPSQGNKWTGPPAGALPDRPSPPSQPRQGELALEPPSTVNTQGQLGFSIDAPHPGNVSRNPMPDSGGVAKEAVPPPRTPPPEPPPIPPGEPPPPGTPGAAAHAVGTMERAAWERQQAALPAPAAPVEPPPQAPPDPWGWQGPHSAVTEAAKQRELGVTPQAAAGINVMQPGQVDPTLQHAAAYPAPERTTFEPPRPPDGTNVPGKWAPLPTDRSLVPRPAEGTQGVTEPPVPTDHTRMYQGERHPPNTFTTDRATAERYGAVKAVDVHNKQGMPFFTPSNEPGTFTTRNNIYRTRSRPVEELRTEPAARTAEVPTPEVKPPAPGEPPLPGIKVAGPELEQKLKTIAPEAEPSIAKVRNDLINLFGHAYESIKNMSDQHARMLWDSEQSKIKTPPEPPVTVPPATVPPATKPALATPAVESTTGKNKEVVYFKGALDGTERKARFTEKLTLKEALKRHGVAQGLMGFTPKLRRMMENMIGNMPVYFLPNSEFAKQGKNKFLGLYYWQQDLIFINNRYLDNPKALADTIFHEGVHGITSHALDNYEVKSAVDTIMSDVKKAKPANTVPAEDVGKIKYGFKNAHEFVAEAFSNPAFQRMLKNHILSPNIAKQLREKFNAQTPIKSAWDAMVQSVRKVLKLPESEMSALEAVMRATQHAMTENPKAKADYMASHGFQTQDYSTGTTKAKVEASRPEVQERPLGDEPRVDASAAPPEKEGKVRVYGASGAKIITGKDVHDAAAIAKKAGYKPSQIHNMDMTLYKPPKATPAPAATTTAAQTGVQTPTPAPTAGGGAGTPPKGPPLVPTPAPGTPPSPPGRIMQAVHTAAEKLLDVGHSIQMLASPMTRGTQTTMALAKDFANSLRRNQWEWTQLNNKIERDHTPERRKAMWEAADAESVAQQQGKSAGNAGLAGLSPEERATVQDLHARGKDAWERARALGMVEGEGLPAYTPRMLINLARSKDGSGPSSLDPMGINLRTTTPQLKKRSHLTTAETEAAAQAKFGPNAEVVKDIRTLPMAIAKLENAIAGRTLVNTIKEIGKRTGQNTVMEGAKPSEPGWFTLDHPALKTWRKSGDNFVQVPIYIHGDFEGPLRAVLTKPANDLYRKAMDLKGKTMGLIMNSPMIHNAVEWGRALPTMPGKILTMKVYFEGNRAKNDPAVMREAIDNGLVPIGARFFNQDIHGIAESPNLIPGRSWTAKVLGNTVGRLPQKGMTAAEVKTNVLRDVDAAGNFWHNTLLWDRIGDLQMGLYSNFLDNLKAKGVDPQTASRAAAHLANRYAGALPPEAMSRGANMAANMLLFSRSFTLGNIGVMKDMLNGMPKDVRAQIGRDVGSVDPQAASYIKSLARRKAIGAVMMDIGMLYAANSLLQSGINVLKGDKTLDEEARGYVDRFSKQMKHVGENPLELLTPMTVAGGIVGAATGGIKGALVGSLIGTGLSQAKKLSSTQENEPGKEDRVKVGHTKDGTAVYMRLTPGKIGEEFEGYASGPLDMLKRKLGTYARPAWQILSNDKGFGRKVYDPNARTSEEMIKNIIKIVVHVASAQSPEGQIRAGGELITGQGDARLNAAQLFGPVAGTTFSRGAPGGEAQGEFYKARERHQLKLNDALPEIRRLIKTENDDDYSKALEMMNDLGLPKGLQKFYIRTSRDPSTRLSPRAIKDFQRYATPEELQRFQRAQEMQGR